MIYFLSISRGVLAGSCREAKLCCTGRDSSCVVQKAPLNAIIEDLNDKPCYCDHACLKLGDCCTDFKEACGGKRKLFRSLFISLFIALGKEIEWMNLILNLVHVAPLEILVRNL